jgi:hypothetical protein
MVLGLSVTLILGSLFLVSCGGGEEGEMVEQEGEETTEQARIDELQRELNAKNDLIKQLQRENADLQGKVPEAMKVQAGDNHYKIAYTFLTEEKGIPEDEAKRMLKNAYLYDSLLAGFKVGNVSDEGEYSAFLSQGDAVATPGKMKRVEDTKEEAKKVVLRNKITLTEIEGMQQEAACKDKMMMAKKEMEALHKKNAVLEENLSRYKEKTEELNSWLYSVFYLAGSKASLKTSGKNSLGALGYTDFDNRVDLRRETTIELRAADFTLPEIKKVDIVPKTLTENVDYRVVMASDGQFATIHLLNLDKFRLARIIIVVN